MPFASNELQPEGSGFEASSRAHLEKTPHGARLRCVRCAAVATHQQLTTAELVHAFKRAHTRCKKRPSS